jgi:dihydrodipicolinate synthase/N-acetylneuraminate lyase
MHGSLFDTVIAVPPLARNADLTVNREANAQLIEHIQAGGLRTLMYGGNANFQNIGLYEFEATVEMLEELVSPSTNLIVSIGSDFGKMVDQGRLLRRRKLAGVMCLPARSACAPAGIETGIERVAQLLGRPLIAYLRDDTYLPPTILENLKRTQAINLVKYGVVRHIPAEDLYLGELVKRLGGNFIISGIGERPAIAHLETFGVACFTSGLASIVPKLSQSILDAFRAGNVERARALRELFLPLETLRDRYDPIQVLHEAVTLSGTAAMGPMLPLMTNLPTNHHHSVMVAARKLLQHNLKQEEGSSA